MSKSEVEKATIESFEIGGEVIINSEEYRINVQKLYLS